MVGTGLQQFYEDVGQGILVSLIIFDVYYMLRRMFLGCLSQQLFVVCVSSTLTFCAVSLVMGLLHLVVGKNVVIR